jgi:hypothetical protein
VQLHPPNRPERRISQKSIAPRFNQRTTRRQRRRIPATTPRRRTRHRTRHRTTFLGPTGRRRTISQNRSLRLRSSRTVSLQSSRTVGRNQRLRQLPSQAIIRSRTVRRPPGQTIAQSRAVRRPPVRITRRSLIAMSRLSGRRLLRRASVHSPSSALLRRLRMPRPHNHSTSSPWRGLRKRSPRRSRKRSLRKSQKGMRSRRSNGWT